MSEAAVSRWQRLAESQPVQWGRGWYQRHRLLAPAVFFFGGVIWDALTLTRIDAVVDNVLLGIYLVLLGILGTVAVLVRHGAVTHAGLLRFRDWYAPAIQFLLGALFSVYVVFYGQSASFSETSIFLVVLVALLIGNEFIGERAVNLYVWLTLYFVVCCSFFIFAIPVFFKVMSYGTFIAGTLLAASIVAGLVWLFRQRNCFRSDREAVWALVLVAALFGLMHLLYLQNWMPPVPLALRSGGIYHHVSSFEEDGQKVYRVQYAKPPWYQPWQRTDATFRYTPADTAFAYTSIFAPTGLSTGIVHVWSQYDATAKIWRDTDTIAYRSPLVGQRTEGYRGYTFKRQVRPGRWKVEVRTDDGRVLGRMRFEALPVDEAVPLRERLIY
ncbi:MAG: DUF2914 domain-containing protein [Rhodothermales bacterium]